LKRSCLLFLFEGNKEKSKEGVGEITKNTEVKRELHQ